MNNTFDGIKKNIADLRREKPPIATSLKQMPEDARAITCAIYKNITMVHHDGDLMPVNFTGTAMSQFSSDQKVLQNFTLTGAHLYEHEPSHIKGALFLEDAVGRRSSLSYDATYQRTGENIIIDTIELTPIYSPDPEPVLLVVPADRIPSNPADLPSSHTGMLQFAAVRAVNPTQPEDGFYGIREYVVMAFFLIEFRLRLSLISRFRKSRSLTRGITRQHGTWTSTAGALPSCQGNSDFSLIPPIQ